MKKNGLFLLLFLFGVQLVFAQQKTRIRGTITNPRNHMVAIIFNSHPLTLLPEGKEVQLNEKGEFDIELELESAVSAHFIHARRRAPIYLYPGDDIDVRLDGERLHETISYRGIGKGIAASNFMAAFQLTFDSRTLKRERYEQIKRLNATRYKKARKEAYEVKMQFLWEHKELEQSFVRYIQNRELYKYANELMNYPSFHGGMENTNRKPDVSYYDFLKMIPIQNDAMLRLPEYLEFLNAYLEFKSLSLEPAIGFDNRFSQRFRMAENVLKGEQIYLIQAKLLIDAIEYSNSSMIKEIYLTFIQSSEGAKYQTYLKAVFPTSQSSGSSFHE